LRDVGVHGVDQLEDRGFADVALVAFQGLERAAGDDGDVVAGEVVAAEQFADFHFHQFEQFGVVDHVGFVEVDHDARDPDLTRQQNVFAGLRHRAVGGRDHQYGTVHLRGAGDHVLDVVGVPGAVDVGVVPLGRLVFHMRRGDGDAARLFFRRGVNLVVGFEFATELRRHHLRDRRRQRGLAVVYVANRPHVDVRLAALKLFFGHPGTPLKNCLRPKTWIAPHQASQ
jgi:hypothetical protein